MSSRGHHQISPKECLRVMRRIGAMDGMVGVITGRSHGLPEAGSQIINVRPSAKAESQPGPGVRNIPLPQLRPRLSEIDSSQLVLKICQMGKMSYPAAHTLQQNCFDAHSIIGSAHLNS